MARVQVQSSGLGRALHTPEGSTRVLREQRDTTLWDKQRRACGSTRFPNEVAQEGQSNPLARIAETMKLVSLITRTAVDDSQKGFLFHSLLLMQSQAKGLPAFLCGDRNIHNAAPEAVTQT